MRRGRSEVLTLEVVVSVDVAARDVMLLGAIADAVDGSPAADSVELSQRDLVERTGLAPATLGRAVASCERNSWLAVDSRRYNEDGGRRPHLYALTASGWAIVESARRGGSAEHMGDDLSGASQKASECPVRPLDGQTRTKMRYDRYAPLSRPSAPAVAYRSGGGR